MPIGQWFRRHGAVSMIAVVAAGTSTACTSSDDSSSTVPPPPKHVVAFIGDSYTDPPFGGPAFWQTTAFRMCWQAEPFGVSGSGYTIAGFDGRGPYVTRIEDVAAVKPDIVIVEGSFNDREPDLVEKAAAIMFRSLHQRLPAARVFAMGPVTPSLPGAGPQVARISEAVKAAAQANFTVFIDATHFLDDPAMYEPDQLHPSPKGHQIIGGELADAMPAELSSCE